MSSAEGLAISLVSGGLAYGTPLVFAGVGECLSERGGVLNLGVEGMMLVGAAGGFGVARTLDGPAWLVLILAIGGAAASAAVLALIFAFVSLRLKANQVVAGLAISILGGAAGFSSYVASIGQFAGKPGKHYFHQISVPGLRDIPFIGPAVFTNQTVLVYVAWLVAAVAAGYLYFTRQGLQLRACGENPAAADAMGVRVTRYQFWHVILGGGLAGVGGAAYSLALLPSWSNGMTVGAGYIAIGLVIVGLWRPELVAASCYVFGVILSLGFALQNIGINLPIEFFNSLPYIATIVVLVAIGSLLNRRRIGGPLALGRVYTRGE